MIAFDDAQRLVLAAGATLGSERVALLDAVGRVTARDLRASEDLVPFARSAMDGYAVASSDTFDEAAIVSIGAPIYAERSGARRHERGTATPIATGGPLPEGADAVVPVEDAERTAGGIRFARPLRPGEHVFPAGEDARAGELLVRAGARIAPAALGLLAAAGFALVDVVRRPRVSLVCSGQELVAVEEAPGRGQVRNSNGAMIAAAVLAAGAELRSNVHVRDDPGELSAAVENALATSDLVITTGGASVGERDFMKPVMRRAGVAFAFDEVSLRPARPFAFGSRGRVSVAVLPGNPSAAFVALVEFVLPLLRALQGSEAVRPPRVRARLLDSIHARPNRTYAPYVALRLVDAGMEAMPLANQCSALTRTAAEAAGLAIVPPGTVDYVPGDVVDVDVLDWSRVRIASGELAVAAVPASAGSASR